MMCRVASTDLSNTPPADAELLPLWVEPVRRLGAQHDVTVEGERLLAAYRREHRRYHDVVHLMRVLRHVEELSAFAADADLVRVAAWFHDAVYDVTSPDNEAASAVLAETVLDRLDVDPDCTAEVSRLVRLTAGHVTDPADRDGAVLCDADLAVLGGSPEDYADYAASIRAEYAHVDDAAFATGRAAVLRSLLDRPVLFRTPYGREYWERRARINVERELAFLQSA
jgi:predicted metal-dependent HD superfamily phosphohydrolase